MDTRVGDRRADHFVPPPPLPTDSGHFHYDGGQDHFHGGLHHPDYRHNHNFNSQQNVATGHIPNGDSNHSLPLSGNKRQFPVPKNGDCGGFVKLYAAGVTRTATEPDINDVFGEFGDIVEVVLLKDKRTGLQQECCFVKYATIEQAERAIVAFNSQYTFPGAVIPLKVKYADGERDRLESLGHFIDNRKLYVGGLNRQSLNLKREIEEIFSPFGVIEEVFIVKDESYQSRGCAFLQFIRKDMALAAIRALHGTYVMKGCEQPLIVRFADPKKPRTGDSRHAPYSNAPTSVHMSSNERQQIKSSRSGCNMEKMASNDTTSASHAFDSKSEIEDPVECNWSEHVSPDGELYYYNCLTCESRWEMPEEYALYEQELDNWEEQQQQQQQQLKSIPSPEVSVTHKL